MSIYNKIKTHKKESIALFLVVLIALSSVLVLVYQQIQKQKKDCGSIRITCYGEEVGVYPLNKDLEIPIGDTNVCKIENGTCSMIEANCPDQVCVYMYPINEEGGLIVCLPNEIIIEGLTPENAANAG